MVGQNVTANRTVENIGQLFAVAAITNFRFLASDLWSIGEVAIRLSELK